MNRPFSFFAIFAGAALAASAASADDVTVKKFGDANGWTVNAASSDGVFMNCEAMAPGAQASLSKSREGWVLKAATKSKGDEVKGSFDIDGKSTKATFGPFDGGLYGVFLKPAQVKALQAGKALSVKIGADETKLSIEGLAVVTRKIDECLKKNSQ